MLIIDHKLSEAIQRSSAHCDDKPAGEVSLVVLHCISLPEGQYNTTYIDDLFMGCIDCGAHDSFASLDGVRVSAHVVINRDGRISQYVPFNRRAWHAGVSSFNGREKCNDYSIGIELEGTDKTPFTDAQYDALNNVLGALLSYYPDLTLNAIVGHSDIAPGRKTDPGIGFDWQRVRSSLGQK